MVGHHLGLSQIGSTSQTYGKGVQTGPICLGLRIVLDAMLTKLLSDGRDDRGIETAREQHAVRHIGHQLTLNGSGQTVADGFY